MKKRTSRLIIELLAFVVLIILDQITKNMAVNLLKDKEPIPIIKNVLELYYLPNGNTGAAFGLLEGHQSLFTFIAIVVVLLIGYILVSGIAPVIPIPLLFVADIIPATKVP